MWEHKFYMHFLTDVEVGFLTSITSFFMLQEKHYFSVLVLPFTSVALNCINSKSLIKMKHSTAFYQFTSFC